MKTENILVAAASFAVGAMLFKGGKVSGVGASKLDSKVFPYILNAIDCEGYNVECNTPEQKLQFLYDTFKSEYGWNISRMGTQRAFAEWLQGLPSSFNIDYTYSDIIRLGKKWGSIPQDATERQEDKLTDNWWNFITVKTFQLMRKHGIAV